MTTANTATASPPTRCLGRDQELAELSTCYDAALQRRSTFVLVTGQPGIGKSTFLDEAQQQLRQRGALVLPGTCRPGLPAYRPLLGPVRTAVQSLCNAGAAEEILLAGQSVLEVLSGKRPAGIASRLVFFDRLALLLQAVSDVQPVALVLHDLESADSATLHFVSYLGRVLSASPALPRGAFRGLILASSRGQQVLPAFEQWHESVNLVQMELGGLDASGVRAYLSSDTVVRTVTEATGGVPQLIRQMVQSSAELSHSDLTLDLTLLDPAPQALLRLLAVAGRPLGPDTLMRLAQLPEEGLARAIAELTRRGLINKSVGDGELRVAFSRAGEQRQIYRDMDPVVRRQLHAAVASHLAQLGDVELEARAHHALHGGCDQAVATAIDAGQRLELAFAFERAAELYELALGAVGEDDEATRDLLVQRLCAVYEITGQAERALAHARTSAAARPDDPHRALRVAHLLLVQGDFHSARRELDILLQGLERTSSELLPRVLADKAWAQYLAGETDQAKASAALGLEHCRRDPISRIALQNTMGKIHLDLEVFDEARELFLDNLELSRQWEAPAEEVRALVQLGQVSLQSEELEAAERWYVEARDLAQRIGEHRYLGVCLQHLGVLAERSCDYATALQLYQEAVTHFRKVEHRSYLAWVALDLGGLYLRLGDVSRATAMADLARAVVPADPPAATTVNMALLRGRIAAHQCHYRQAQRLFQRARSRAQRAQQPEREARARLELARLALDQGLAQFALRELSEARLALPGPSGTQTQATEAQPRGLRLSITTLLLEGRALLALERAEEAREVLLQAREAAQQRGDLEAGWQALFLLAQVARLQGRRAEARRLLTEASAGEYKIRATVPAEFQESFLEQPLRVALHQALGHQRAGRSQQPLTAATARNQEPGGQPRCGDIVGQHPRMRQIFRNIEKVAPTDALVLIRGESGTGKELIAEALHRMSERSERPLVKVNCGALVESLLLSELFGHERGAFTGAQQRRKGRFEAANGGTIFLDEIGDISPKTQVALLRVLQNQEFERVGGTESIRVDVRIICATNRDLEQMVRDGAFREDLYYRLRGVLVDVPPLRTRKSDIDLLAEHFLTKIAAERNSSPKQLTAAARASLRAHPWPGNVRELENVLRSVSLFTDGAELDSADFADYPELRCCISAAAPSCEAPAGAERAAESPFARLQAAGMSLKELKKQIELQCISEAMRESDGNITRAAKLLGMKRPRLSQLVKEHGILSAVNE